MNKKVKYLLICLLIIILLLIAIFSIVKTKKDKEDKIDNTKTEEKIVKEDIEEKTDIEIPQEEEPKEIEEPVEEPPKEEPKKEEKPSTKPKQDKPKQETKPSTPTEPQKPTEPPVTYTCPDGYTLNDTKCTITIDATLKCPEGTLEGGEPSGCFKFSEGVEVEGETCPSGQVGLLVISLGGPDKYNCYPSYKKVYTCEEGYTLNNNKCTKTIDAIKK